MKTLSFWKKSIYSALVFFGTVVVLTVGYAVWNSPYTMTTVGSGSGLTANGWNALVNNLNDLNTRVGDIGVTKINGTLGNITTNIPTGVETYIGDSITLTPGKWIVYYSSFYDTDNVTSFGSSTVVSTKLSTNTNSSGIFSRGNLGICNAGYCPTNQMHQVTVTNNTTTYYIIHSVGNYNGSYVRLRGGEWGNFFAIKTN